MSPELERLLTALYERDTCEPRDRARWNARVERLIAESLSKQPAVDRDQFMEALRPRYIEFSSCPPKADHATTASLNLVRVSQRPQ